MDIVRLIELFVLFVFTIFTMVCLIMLLIIVDNTTKHNKSNHLEVKVELTKLLFHITLKK